MSFSFSFCRTLFFFAVLYTCICMYTFRRQWLWLSAEAAPIRPPIWQQQRRSLARIDFLSLSFLSHYSANGSAQSLTCCVLPLSHLILPAQSTAAAASAESLTSARHHLPG